MHEEESQGHNNIHMGKYCSHAYIYKRFIKFSPCKTCNIIAIHICNQWVNLIKILEQNILPAYKKGFLSSSMTTAEYQAVPASLSSLFVC